MTTRSRRPSIHKIGTAQIIRGDLTLHGWAFGLCAARCRCHQHPLTGSLVLQQDQVGKRIGLASYPPTPAAQPSPASAAQPPLPCCCCQPWTVDELVAILRDLDYIAVLQTTPPASADQA